MTKLIEMLEDMGQKGESDLSPKLKQWVDLYADNQTIKCLGVLPEKEDEDEHDNEDQKDSISAA